MRKLGGVLVLAILLVLAPSCASVNGKQAAIEGGAGAVIGTVLGFAVGTTLGDPSSGARIGAAIGATTGTTHGLFNRDEEIVDGQKAVIVEEKKTQEALALSNQALAQVLERQSAAPKLPVVTSPTTASIAPSAKPKSRAAATSQKKPAVKKSATLAAIVPNAATLCRCDEVEVYNAASFGIRVKAGQDPMGTFVPAQTPVCLPQGKVFAKAETVPPSDWVVRDPGSAKRIIFQDGDFK